MGVIETRKRPFPCCAGFPWVSAVFRGFRIASGSYMQHRCDMKWPLRSKTNFGDAPDEQTRRGVSRKLTAEKPDLTCGLALEPEWRGDEGGLSLLLLD